MRTRRALRIWVLLTALLPSASAQEFRGLWVDAFHPGFRSRSEVTRLIADARAGHFNALVVEIRKRGDAYYDSRYEPKAGEVSPPSFDPLAELIAQAHHTNNGPRLEVHAWIVTYPIWNSPNLAAAPPNHPVRLHPDWLTTNQAGSAWNGANLVFDPGHPEVQRHTFNVALDIIARYDVDGLNFDYVRYHGDTWGYHGVAVARFNRRFGRQGDPAPEDPAWLQWRRDQVTALVRKVYLSARALKPQVKISADTIAWAPGVTTDTDWTNAAAAYRLVLQDWRAWMEEGILDLNLPMTYFDQAGPFGASWTNWNTFVKNHRYNRHAVIGCALYLNPFPDALRQMRFARTPSPDGHTADGLCAYSYASPGDPAPPRSTVLAALTLPQVARHYDPNRVPLFASRATPPVMPWLVAPNRGHLKGLVSSSAALNTLDGATVTLSGPSPRTGLSDATGFYGLVDLPPGTYTVTAAAPGEGAAAREAVITAGVVTTLDLVLSNRVSQATGTNRVAPLAP